jgi:raffinose/stachyose/melibiose transport system permease protein
MNRAARHVLLVLVCLVFGYPLIWMVLGAFKTQQTFFSDLWGLPQHWNWSNFSDAWSTGHIGRYLLNSIIVTGVSVLLVLGLGYPLAYAIARMRFRGNRLLLGLFAITLFVPIQLLLIPIYELEGQLGIVDTYWALILPYSAGALPFAVIFASTYLRSIPRELEEAAMLDGAHQGRILTQIMMPLSRPALATVVIFTFLNVWNEFVIALTVTQSDSVRTLPVGLLNFSQQFGITDYPQLFGALTMSALPIIAVFLLCQRQFIQGLVAGAVKL